MRTTDPTCQFGCGQFYLEPDPTFGFIYLSGYDFYPYVGTHVEVLGSRGSCGGCTVLSIVTLTVLPPLDVEEHEEQLPRSLALGQNYPNPFNPQTIIQFSLPRAQYVSLTIHNALGQVVGSLVNETLPVGEHIALWDAKNIPGGVYYYRLSTADGTMTRQMLLIR